MQKYLLLFSIILGACKGPSSQNNTAEKTGTKKDPALAKSAAHVQVPGSHLYLIPPTGFSSNSTTMQLEKEGATIMMMQFFAGKTPASFFAELKAQSEKDYPGYWKEETINAGGHTASLYRYKAFGLAQHYLHFTDGSTDQMLVARFDENDSATAAALYKALQTTLILKSSGE